MQSPSLNSRNKSHLYSHIYASGNVVVHPSAAVAPGVLLQADPGCCLTIAAGVCVGQGVVLHACWGNLTVETGCTLGRGVLIVGKGQIGTDACIGAFTTVWNSSIAAGQILPPNSLVGEAGRQVALEPAKPAESVPDPWATEPAPAPYFKAEFVSGFSVGFSSANGGVNSSANGSAYPPISQPPASQPPASQPSIPQTPVSKPSAQVYGQAYVERMMIAMFPHRHPLSQPDDPDSASPPAD